MTQGMLCVFMSNVLIKLFFLDGKCLGIDTNINFHLFPMIQHSSHLHLIPYAWKRRTISCDRARTKQNYGRECLWHYRYLPRYLFIFVSNKWSSLLCFSTAQYWINLTFTNLNDFVRFGKYFWRLWIFFERGSRLLLSQNLNWWILSGQRKSICLLNLLILV